MPTVQTRRRSDGAEDHTRSQATRRKTRASAICLLVLLAGLPALQAAPPALAGSGRSGCKACLGSMTKDGTPWWAPTDNFKRGGMPFRKGKLLQVVMLGARGDGTADRMIWPMVKALSQFGTWTRLVSAAPFCPNNMCEAPTFDLGHARFHSHYIAFVYRSIATRDSTSLVGTLTARQKRFFDKYVRAPGYSSDSGYVVWATEGGGGPDGSDRLPGISIGPYLSLGTKLLVPGYFETIVKTAGPPGVTASGLPFATVQQALVQADRTHYASLVHAVNAEANLFTAVICKADGSQPRKACDRGVVRGIAKHLR